MNFTQNPILKWILNTSKLGLEHTARRFYSIYQGSAATTIDSRQQGAIKVRVPDTGVGSVVKKQFIPSEFPQEALPVSPYAGRDHGFYFPPEPGDAVWVSFGHGHLSTPRYLGGWWANEIDGPSGDASELPDEFTSWVGLSVSANRDCSFYVVEFNSVPIERIDENA